MTIIYCTVAFILITKGEYEPSQFRTEYKKLRFYKKCLRILITALLILGTEIILGQKSSTINIYHLAMIQIVQLATQLFLLIKVQPYLYCRLQLDVGGDLLRFDAEQKFWNFMYKKKDFLDQNYL